MIDGAVSATDRAKTVLVTGGAGFIGSNLVRHLDALGMTAVVLDDFSTGSWENLSGVAARIVEGSILDPRALDAAMTGAGSVVHLAARPSVPRSLDDPVASHDANATGTLQVLEAARRHSSPHVVLASSSSVYGANEVLPKSEDLTPMPVSPYAVSKLAAESYALAYQRCFGLDTLVFRFFNVYGPGQPAGHAYAAVVPAFVGAALKGRALTVNGDGQQTRDFTFVGTVVDVLARAVTGRMTRSRPLNLAFGTRASLNEVIDELESILGRSLKREYTGPRSGDVRDSQADSTQLRMAFPGVDPVMLRVGLTSTVEWHRELNLGAGVNRDEGRR